MQKNSCCKPEYPWHGRGASAEITGCRFALYPMSDAYGVIITDALRQTDTGGVWAGTDALGTVYRGKLAHVVDAVQGLFAMAWRPGVHMAMEGQFSKGCPGDVDADAFLSVEERPVNFEKISAIHFPVQCKIALYPLGAGDYMDQIAEVYRMAEQAGLHPATTHYATRLWGDVQQVFAYFQQVCEFVQQRASHYILTFTLSVNSPTKER
ncbi:MAG: YkoF family thiamine/hydroxymethylpyrimidine-binding protein [Oscillospiraceae bacterium]